jgi:hypothetical protein
VRAGAASELEAGRDGITSREGSVQAGQSTMLEGLINIQGARIRM